MYSAWTQHIADEEDKNKFKERLLRNKDILDVQSEILKKELAALESAEVSLKTFDTPNWENKQAFYLGYKACAQTVNKLNNL